MSNKEQLYGGAVKIFLKQKRINSKLKKVPIMKLTLTTLCVASVVLAGCIPNPTASNYNDYMNTPQAKAGTTATIDGQLANKAAWNKIEVTQMSLLRTLPDGSYAQDNTQGMLTVRATLVNSGDTPVQGNWRCKFYDSNNLPLYESESNKIATDPNGIGWHQNMIVYPLKSKSQTDDANVINCKAQDSRATNYRVEFHDTANDVTIYKR
jgi:hypothetical protein